jgi:hypothetical protein
MRNPNYPDGEHASPPADRRDRADRSPVAWLPSLLAPALVGGVVLVVLLPIYALVSYGWAESRSRENLRRLALAMLACNDRQGRMPAHAIYSKDGVPLLSWRVALLPDLGHEELYDEFHLDEPWDSEHNKRLLPRIPLVYMPPVRQRGKVAYGTYYQVFLGPPAPFSGPCGPRVPDTFQDGTSWTILIAEAGEPVPWTKPEDIPYDPNKPLPKLGGLFRGRWSFVMADGEVRTYPKGYPSESTLRAAITAYGGEIMNGDW